MDPKDMMFIYARLQGLAPAYGISSECYLGASDRLQRCLQDLMMVDGCCSAECFDSVNSFFSMNPDGSYSPCLESWLTNLCKMAADGMPIEELIGPLFGMASRCLLGIYYNCNVSVP